MGYLFSVRVVERKGSDFLISIVEEYEREEKYVISVGKKA